jgi:WD domain, G-beta repeat
VNSVAFSPDSRSVLSGHSDGTIKLWDVATGKLLRTFLGPPAIVHSVAFSPDGRTMLSGSWDNTLKLWDVATGQLLRTLQGHSDWVNSVAFSPDGRTALSGSNDTSIILWSVSSGESRLRLLATPSGDDWVALAPAGFFALKGDRGKLLHLVRGFQVLSVEQVFEILHRPDFVEAQLNGDSEGRYKNATYLLDLETILDSGAAPQIERLVEEDVRADDSIRLRVRITDRGGGVGKQIIWRVNGVMQGSTMPDALGSVTEPLASVIVTETLRLEHGKVNLIDLTAYNKAGLVATPPFKIMVDKFGTRNETAAHVRARPRGQ